MSTFEQPPAKAKEKRKDYPDELYHRVKVERNPQTGRAMDVQIPKFRRMGYEEITAESDEDFVVMTIPREEYNRRAREREEKTTRALMEPAGSGIEGETLNKVSVSRMNAETFFSGDGEE